MKLLFHIDGMHCSGCAGKVETELAKQPTVEKVFVNFVTSQAVVVGNYISQKEIFEIVKRLGYIPKQADIVFEEAAVHYKKLFLVALVLTIPTMVFSMVLHHSVVLQWIQCILTTMIILYSGRYFFIAAFKQLTALYTSMDTLISLGVGGSYVYSLLSLITGHGPVIFETSAVIITFVLYGKLVEHTIKTLSAHEFTALQKMTQKLVSVERKGQKHNIFASQILQGDILKVLAGEAVLADGMILEGASEIDESTLTGEPLPIVKGVGDPVYAGTMNLTGSLTIHANKDASFSVFSGILKAVEEAQLTKAPFQRIADRASAIFVPMVIAIALITFVLTLIYTHTVFSAFLSFLAVLVVSCPCALGLATPIVTQFSVGLALKKKIAVKDTSVFETASRLKTLIFDKTGTLTVGKPVVFQFISLTDNMLFLDYISSLERESNHPLANSIADSLEKQGQNTIYPVEKVKYIIGEAITGVINGDTVEIGSLAYARKHFAIDDQFEAVLQDFASELGTEIVAAVNSTPVAVFKLQDQLRENAQEVIFALKKMGVHPVICSGDTLANTQAVAQELGIQDYYAETKPQEKGHVVIQYKKEPCVGMVGDGINDAVALAQADLSFAVTTANDIAACQSMIVLLDPDLSQVSYFIQLSQKAVCIMKQNLFMAFIYNVFAIPFAAFGFLHPMSASLMMMLSSLAVVSNSARLK